MTSSIGALSFSAPLRLEEFKAAGDEWLVSGYASTWNNVDLGGDVVLAGAFDRTLADGHRVKFLHSHDPRMVLGVPKALKTDKKGLFGTFSISKTQLGEDTRTLVKDGALDGFSIGYIAREVDWTEKGEVRQLKDVDLLEVSLVAMPMNPEALVTSVKGALERLGVSLTLAQRLSLTAADLDEIAAELATLAGTDRPLTDTKRQEIEALRETFSRLDAVRPGLDALLAGPLEPAPPAIAAGAGVSLSLAYARTRSRLRERGIILEG
jgi:HK97 family phage prohead protease